MKKVFGLLAIVSMVAFVSCKSSTPAATEETTTTETEVVADETAEPVADTAQVVEETPAQ